MRVVWLACAGSGQRLGSPGLGGAAGWWLTSAGGARGSGSERVDRVERGLEDRAVAEAGGWAEDQAPAGAHDPCGNVEQQVAQGLGRPPERRVVGRLARGARGGA